MTGMATRIPCLLKMCFLMIALLSPLAMAQVYKTVDENGRVSYSDKPLNDNSEQIELRDENTMPAPQAQPKRLLPPGSDDDGIPESYTVSITSPQTETYVQNEQRDVTVQVNTSPDVHSSHRLEVTDNGTPLAGPVIEEIGRGQHTFVAKIVDENGRVLGQSAPVVIYVQRPSLNSPAR